MRTQVSLLLDGEVSELDRRLVAAHLARCADCRAFEEPLRAFTAEIHAAPFESPDRPIYVARPRRRVSLGTVQYSAAATLLIATLSVVSQFGAPRSQTSDARPQFTVATLFSASWEPEQELAQLDPAVAVGSTDPPGPVPAV